MSSVDTSSPPPDYLFKVLMIGEIAVGKTCFIKRAVEGVYHDAYKATIGTDFGLKVLQNVGKPPATVRLQLWDIAGQERFGNMTRVYFKEAQLAFISFDITKEATFNAVIKWKSDLDAKVTGKDGMSIPAILLATKCDLVASGNLDPIKSDEELDLFAKKNNFIAWFKTSAKRNENVTEAIEYAAQVLISSNVPTATPSAAGIHLDEGPRERKPFDCAC